jgi:hypothetical protein
VAVVARDSAHCSSLLSEVRHMAEGLREALLSDVATEIIPFGSGGAGVQGGIEQALTRNAPYDDDDDDQGEN